MAYLLLKRILSHSFVEVHQLFWQRFPEREPPTKKWYGTMHEIMNNAEQVGTGMLRTLAVREPDNIDAVQEALKARSTGVSCWRNNLGLPSALVNRIIGPNLNWHPYRFQRRQRKDEDYVRRTAFCEMVPDTDSNLVFGNEANFGVNSQNVRRYVPRGNQPEYTEVSESREKCMVWIVCGDGNWSIFFVRNMNGLMYIDVEWKCFARTPEFIQQPICKW